MMNPLTLLQQRAAAQHGRRLELWGATRVRLRQILGDLLPGGHVIVFGSLTRPGVFNESSDIDLALPEGMDHADTWASRGELMERLERPVDVVALKNCRFRQKILREGELWTL